MESLSIRRLWAAALCATAASSASASPWGRAAGEAFISTRTDYFYAEDRAPQSEDAGARRLERISNDLYTEWGVDGDWTVGGKVVYGVVSFFDGFSGFSADGVSEAEGFVQRTLHRDDRQVFAIRATGGVPSRLTAGARPGLASDGADLEARALYGRTLARAPLKVFAVAEAAYRRRLGDGADEARFVGALGVEPSRATLFLIEAQSTVATSAAAPGGADFDILRLQASAIWRGSRRWSVAIGGTHEPAGRNVLRGSSAFLGLWSSF